MKIDSKTKFHDVPLIKIRDFLRKNRDGFHEDWFCENFKKQEDSGKPILMELQKDGYVEKGRIIAWDFDLTPKGQQLASATATRKVKRATAVRALRKMLDRVEEINEGSVFLYRITDIKVFGNFLGNVENLSDVDLCVNLMPKFVDYVFEEKSNALIRDEIQKGRSFQNNREQTAWPRRTVLNHLRGKERTISIIEDGDAILENIDWDFLFRIESGTNVGRFPELA